MILLPLCLLFQLPQLPPLSFPLISHVPRRCFCPTSQNKPYFQKEAERGELGSPANQKLLEVSARVDPGEQRVAVGGVGGKILWLITQ